MSYPGHSLGGGLTPLQRCSQCILQPQLTEQFIARVHGVSFSFFSFLSILSSNNSPAFFNSRVFVLPKRQPCHWPLRTYIQDLTIKQPEENTSCYGVRLIWFNQYCPLLLFLSLSFFHFFLSLSLSSFSLSFSFFYSCFFFTFLSSFLPFSLLFFLHFFLLPSFILYSFSLFSFNFSRLFAYFFFLLSLCHILFFYRHADFL